MTSKPVVDDADTARRAFVSRDRDRGQIERRSRRPAGSPDAGAVRCLRVDGAQRSRAGRPRPRPRPAARRRRGRRSAGSRPGCCTPRDSRSNRLRNHIQQYVVGSPASDMAWPPGSSRRPSRTRRRWWETSRCSRRARAGSVLRRVEPDRGRGRREAILTGLRRTGRASPRTPWPGVRGRGLTYREFDERAPTGWRAADRRGRRSGVVGRLAVRRSVDLMVGMYAVRRGGRRVRADRPRPPGRAHGVTCSRPPPGVRADHRARRGVALPAGAGTVVGSTPSTCPGTRPAGHRRGPRRSPLRAGQPRVRDLHLRVDRTAEGRRGQPRARSSTGCRGCRTRTRSTAARRRAAEDPDDVRRVGVGAVLAAAGRCAAGARRRPDGHRDPALPGRG